MGYARFNLDSVYWDKYLFQLAPFLFSIARLNHLLRFSFLIMHAKDKSHGPTNQYFRTLPGVNSRRSTDGTCPTAGSAGSDSSSCIFVLSLLQNFSSSIQTKQTFENPFGGV
jgi:hypothetical protein